MIHFWSLLTTVDLWRRRRGRGGCKRQKRKQMKLLLTTLFIFIFLYSSYNFMSSFFFDGECHEYLLLGWDCQQPERIIEPPSVAGLKFDCFSRHLDFHLKIEKRKSLKISNISNMCPQCCKMILLCNFRN